MKASSGRLGQYLLLNSVESLSNYLVETELFSKASLYDFIEKYKSFVIKPVFGSGEVCVLTEKSKFRIVSKTNSIVCTEKEEVYQYIVRNEIKQKYYVIKPIKMNCRYTQSNHHYFVTVHRESVSHEWRLLSYTEKTSSKNGRGVYRYFRHEIRNVSMLVAKKLGDSFPECNTIVIEIVYDMTASIWIQDTVLHFPKSKWNQYMALMSSNPLQSFVPSTNLFTKCTFHDYLTRYHEVIIKPCYGQEGVGILQISLTHDLSFKIRSGIKTFSKATFEEAYQFIEERYLAEKDYIIQPKLRLATIDDCPIDCRVIVQKVDSTWKSTGKIVKVAGEGFFITNAAQELFSLENAIQDSNMSWVNIDVLEDKINQICILAAERLEENKAGIKIIGFDIGITDRGVIWIIEGNDTPDLSMFYKLEDKEMYRAILTAKRN